MFIHPVTCLLYSCCVILWFQTIRMSRRGMGGVRGVVEIGRRCRCFQKLKLDLFKSRTKKITAGLEYKTKPDMNYGYEPDMTEPDMT